MAVDAFAEPQHWAAGDPAAGLCVPGEDGVVGAWLVAEISWADSVDELRGGFEEASGLVRDEVVGRVVGEMGGVVKRKFVEEPAVAGVHPTGDVGVVGEIAGARWVGEVVEYGRSRKRLLEVAVVIEMLWFWRWCWKGCWTSRLSKLRLSSGASSCEA